jgi:simple sugar transport system ATP-binding protein
MRGITKRFPAVVANDHVDFEAAEGEVHALLGENGAGKSTLSNILAGLYRADEGEIDVYGQRVEFHAPRDALDAGISMVHQHFRLVERFTVAENVALSDHRREGRSFRFRSRAIERRVAELGERYGLAVDPRAHIWQLSVGEQQRVEILKALYPTRDPDPRRADRGAHPRRGGGAFARCARWPRTDGRSSHLAQAPRGEGRSDRVTVLVQGATSRR